MWADVQVDRYSFDNGTTRRREPAGPSKSAAKLVTGAQGEEMTGKNSDEVLNMRKRTALQYLSVTDGKLVDRLPVAKLALSMALPLRSMPIRGGSTSADAGTKRLSIYG